MMWPIFRPDDTEYASDTNRTHPADDVFSEGERIARLLAELVAANGTSEDPVAYGALSFLWERVPIHRVQLRQTLGAADLDEVLAKHIQHACAGHARQHRAESGRQGSGRQHD